jgi:hypothetical protein
MFLKPRVIRKSSRQKTDRASPSQLEKSGEPNENLDSFGEAVKSCLHPPAEEDLGGGDICSLEEKPSTEDNTPLVAHQTTDSAKEVGFDNYNAKRSLVAVASALTIAAFGTLSLLIVDHGLWRRPRVESARAHAATEAAAEADGAFVSPTRRPSLYSRHTK